MGIHLLTLASPAIAFLFAALFFGAWVRWRTLRYLLWLASAFLLFAVALLSQITLTPADLGLNAVGSCILYTAATLAFGEGFLRRLGLRSHVVFNGAVAVLVVAGTAYFYYGVHWLHGRIFVMNFGLAILLLVTALRARAGGRTYLDRSLFWVLALFALQFFPRTILTVGAFGNIGQELHMSDRPAVVQSPFWVWMNLSFLIFTVLIGLLLAAAIVTDVVAALHRKANTDSLTSLLNRRGFEELTESPRGKAASVLQSLIVFDIDDFKSINDVYGHFGGDVVLSQIGALLKKHIRTSDAAARLGGEEFVVLLSNLEPEAAHAIAERLRQGIANTRFGDGSMRERTVTASFGVVNLQAGETLDQALRRADALLYAAKRNGKNRTVVSQS
ncbi:MAG TPA: GGDEF domain-containing protein [Granulicella sp.]